MEFSTGSQLGLAVTRRNIDWGDWVREEEDEEGVVGGEGLADIRIVARSGPKEKADKFISC